MRPLPVSLPPSISVCVVPRFVTLNVSTVARGTNLTEAVSQGLLARAARAASPESPSAAVSFTRSFTITPSGRSYSKVA